MTVIRDSPCQARGLLPKGVQLSMGQKTHSSTLIKWVFIRHLYSPQCIVWSIKDCRTGSPHILSSTRIARLGYLDLIRLDQNSMRSGKRTSSRQKNWSVCRHSSSGRRRRGVTTSRSTYKEQPGQKDARVLYHHKYPRFQ